MLLQGLSSNYQLLYGTLLLGLVTAHDRARALAELRSGARVSCGRRP